MQIKKENTENYVRRQKANIKKQLSLMTKDDSVAKLKEESSLRNTSADLAMVGVP